MPIPERQTRVVYRSDARQFAQGDVIPPFGDHLPELKGGHRDAEELIRATHDNGIDLRANYLYVFRDFAWAHRYWALGKPRYFYRATVEVDAILHSGDMHIFNQIPTLSTPEQKESFARRYWRGDESDTESKVELIVRQATVLEVLHTPAEQGAAKRELFRSKGQDDSLPEIKG